MVRVYVRPSSFLVNAQLTVSAGVAPQLLDNSLPSPSPNSCGASLSSEFSESFKSSGSAWSSGFSGFCCVTCPGSAEVSGSSPSAARTAVGKSENTMQRHNNRDIIRFFNLHSSKFIKYLYEARQWQTVLFIRLRLLFFPRRRGSRIFLRRFLSK